MQGKHLFAALLAATALLGVASVGTVGAVDNPELPYSENVSVNEDTESLRVLAENIGGDGTADVHFYEVNTSGENRTTTLANSGVLNTSGDGTDSYEFLALDTTNVSTYEVVVENASSVASLTIEKLQVVSGGGALLDDAPTASPVVLGGVGVVVLIAVGGAVVTRR